MERIMAVGETISENWAEVIAMILLIIGFILAALANSVVFIYVIVFISGLLAGRFYFLRVGKKPLFPFFLIIIGFLVGFTLGSFRADRKIVVALFLIAWLISHKLHKEGKVPT